MKITSISVQVRDKNRVSISVDGKYRFSLDINQVIELGLKTGNEVDENQLQTLEIEGKFGKLYGRAVEYCFMRPRSTKELRDYLYRKTLPRRNKKGELVDGYPKELTTRVIERLQQKKYLDDRKFAIYWIENRNLSKGISRRKLMSELFSKGIDSSLIEELLIENVRNDDDEIQKIIKKKRAKYDDQKLMAYLARLGFNYDDIKTALSENQD